MSYTAPVVVLVGKEIIYSVRKSVLRWGTLMLSTVVTSKNIQGRVAGKNEMH